MLNQKSYIHCKKEKLSRRNDKTVSKIYELPEYSVTILIKELEREDIGVGGKLLSDIKK
ncbi:hypothetical protein ALNOE001_10720 [Candidatus Methanobinarius endosymbioticus]|uniref:4-oxalocrotonate tautomerase-like domain-containing protein n=1 Tax=Candidatus Methanobinarius endosymbioticus TaxID=2006182 RepID=A0A366MB99_9EURY|nr:hypothetical protein ALNOE001_10720 [Candidatus Methanobinarius endosymbioticus]